MPTTEDDGYNICIDILQSLQISDTATVHVNQYWNILNTILYVVYYIFQLLGAVIFNFQPGCQRFMCCVSKFHYTKWTGHYSFYWFMGENNVYSIYVHKMNINNIYLSPFNHRGANRECKM
jgi:hypothetical protein